MLTFQVPIRSPKASVNSQSNLHDLGFISHSFLLKSSIQEILIFQPFKPWNVKVKENPFHLSSLKKKKWRSEYSTTDAPLIYVLCKTNSIRPSGPSSPNNKRSCEGI